MAKKRVIKPEMLAMPSGPVASREEAGERSRIAKENTSSVFTHIQKAIGGGRVTPLRGGYVTMFFPTDDPEDNETRHFRPDIVHNREDGMGYTEVKAVSTRSSQPECSVHQLENYAFALLYRRNAGDKIPWVDYVYYRFGDWLFNGHFKLQNGQLISRFADVTRDVLVTSFNLTLFMLLNSPVKAHNQTSSKSTVNSRDYWCVRSSMLNLLHEYKPSEAIEAIMDSGVGFQNAGRRERNELIKELHLGQLVVKRRESPEMQTPYGKPFKPFPITKYRLPNGSYQAWLDHFAENHGRILGRLGIRDLFGELEEHGGPGAVRFGQRASYVTKDALVPF